MAFLQALVPSLGVLYLFWLAIRAIVQADRRERDAELTHRRAASVAGQPQVSPGVSIGDEPTAVGDSSSASGG